MADINMADPVARRKRAAFLVGIGPYESPERPASRALSKNIFFYLVRQLAPKVFDELHSKVYPAFKEHPRWADPRWGYYEAILPDNPNRLPELIAWATYFHMRDVQWFLRQAVDTLHVWAMVEPENPTCYHRYMGGIAPDASIFVPKEEAVPTIVRRTPEHLGTVK